MNLYDNRGSVNGSALEDSVSVQILDTGKVLWGSYSSWEGPLYWGSIQMAPATKDAPFSAKLMSVLGATESGSGRFDAVNCYDRCILTVGIVQWCEAAPQCSVSDMLTLCDDADHDKLDAYLEHIAEGLTIVKDGHGVGRLQLGGVGGAPLQRIDNTAAQRGLFLGGSTGLKGQWTAPQIAAAKKVCAVMASLWQEPEFQAAQLSFTVPKLIEVYGRSFGSGPRHMFDEGFSTEGFAGAMRAIYISYSANLPTVAASIFNRIFPAGLTGDDENDCLNLTKALALSSGVGIWPRRYEMIRPTVEALFGVDLPDHTSDLSAWKEQFDPDALAALPDTKAIQAALIKLGYDLGPTGADGSFGQKSRSALMAFQKSSNLAADGTPGPATLKALYLATKDLP